MKIPFCLIRFAVGSLVAFGAMSCQRQGVEASREKTSDLTPQKILSIDDETFLLAAQKAEIRQTTLSEAALDVSKNEEIRNYAQQVVTNYRKALAELTDLMRAKNIPNVSATAEAIRLEAMNRLHGLSGSAFDHEFVSLMAAEQQAALASCNLTAETAADPDIRNYAKGVLPLLRDDFNTVTGLSKKLAAGELR
jgi:putative membrane protein